MPTEKAVVPFRMPSELKEKLKKMCEDDEVSMAQWMRRAIKRAWADRRPPFS